jgi:hypothetical protein
LSTLQDLIDHTVFKEPFGGNKLREALFGALNTLPIKIENLVLAIESFFLTDWNCSLKRPQDVEFFFRKEYPLLKQYYASAVWLSLAQAIENILDNYSDLQVFFSNKNFACHRQIEAFAKAFNHPCCLGYLRLVKETLKCFPQNFQLFEKNSKHILGYLANMKSVRSQIEKILSPESYQMKSILIKIPSAVIKGFNLILLEFVDKHLNRFVGLEMMLIGTDNTYCSSEELEMEKELQRFLAVAKSIQFKLNLKEVEREFHVLKFFIAMKIQLNTTVRDKFAELSIEDRWCLYFQDCVRREQPYQRFLKLIQYIFSIKLCANDISSVHGALQKNSRWSIQSELDLPVKRNSVFQNSLLLCSTNLNTMTQTKLAALVKEHKHLLE